MATTLLVPGLDGGGDGHWMSWFEAAIPDAERVSPPYPGNVDLAEWAACVRSALYNCDEPVWIIAHGFGSLAAARAAFDVSDRVAGCMFVAPYDPDHMRLAWLLPDEPLGFPAVLVASSDDPRMRLSKAAFWAGFWSCDFVNAGRAGSIDPAAGFGPWAEGLSIFEELKRSPAIHLRPMPGRETTHLSRAI